MQLYVISVLITWKASQKVHRSWRSGGQKNEPMVVTFCCLPFNHSNAMDGFTNMPLITHVIELRLGARRDTTHPQKKQYYCSARRTSLCHSTTHPQHSNSYRTDNA